MPDPTGRRPDESLGDAAQRVATDAVYEARDSGGTMHDAGALAAERVLGIVRAWLGTERKRMEAGYGDRHSDEWPAPDWVVRDLIRALDA